MQEILGTHNTSLKWPFSTMHECNTKQIFVGDDSSLSVVGFETISTNSIGV